MPIVLSELLQADVPHMATEIHRILIVNYSVQMGQNRCAMKYFYMCMGEQQKTWLSERTLVSPCMIRTWENTLKKKMQIFNSKKLFVRPHQATQSSSMKGAIT